MKRLLLIVTGTLILMLALFNPTAFANGKGLAHLIMEQEDRLTQLEEIVQNLIQNRTGSDNSKISPEVKESLLQEVNTFMDSYNVEWLWDEEANKALKKTIINITDIQLNEREGKVLLQIFVEGDYDWTATAGEKGSILGDGRQFAQNFIYNFHAITLMYGVDVHYEFYQNGERITVFK